MGGGATAHPREDERALLSGDVRALRALLNTRGWAVVDEVMRKEMNQAALMLSATAKMVKDVIDFQRGAIWAAAQLLDLPQKLLMRLENDLLMMPSTQDPAKAGSTKE
jgi:hypothetical protein